MPKSNRPGKKGSKNRSNASLFHRNEVQQLILVNASLRTRVWGDPPPPISTQVRSGRVWSHGGVKFMA